MTSRYVLATVAILLSRTAAAQATGGIRVTPSTVSVSSQGPTTSILTFSGLGNYSPAEGLWCARLIARRCDPASIYGQAPPAPGGSISSRVDSTAGGPSRVFMDVMTVPASVAQRAYEAALGGGSSAFFYVRRFVATAPASPLGPSGALLEQYVVVTCLLGASGASAPFALTNVRLHALSETPVIFVKRGDRPPQLYAEIEYTGTGSLRGRWEIVSPGEQQPSAADLLTEASLPIGQRGFQRRYRELERFNVLLQPTGRYTLRGPAPEQLPTSIDGSYRILLRVEVSEDAVSDRRVNGIVTHNGAAAAFPMPTLRYLVTGASSRSASAGRSVRLRLPLADALVPPDSALTLSWLDDQSARRYRVEMERIADGTNVLTAIVGQGAGLYEVPPFVLAAVPGGKVRWRVFSLDAAGGEIGRSEWRAAQRRER